MILIADSGSSKTAWWLVDKGEKVAEFLTSGINPFYQSEDEISFDLKFNLHSKLDASQISTIYFYGAGCHFPDKKKVVSSAIKTLFNTACIEVNNDLLAASRSLFQHNEGIACILGTGSNSCFYDGKEIKENVSPLGFILGDEGSGAVLGKLLVGNVLKNQLPEKLCKKFLTQYKTSTAEVLDNVYKRPFPNRYLAKFSGFLLENIQEPEIIEIVSGSFSDFFRRNVMQYNYQKYEAGFIGSIAFHYKDILTSIAAEMDIRICNIEQSPMRGLLEFHKKDS